MENYQLTPGMWSSAEETSEDFLGRLAIVPMVLEARGLDVTPGMIKLFKNINDMETVNTLETIYSERSRSCSIWFQMVSFFYVVDMIRTQKKCFMN